MTAATNTDSPLDLSQENFYNKLVELRKLEGQLAKLADALPHIPLEYIGPAEILEPGYDRTEQMEVGLDDGGRTFHAYTDGWDSMTEHGSVSYVVIDGSPYQVPDDLDWD